MARKPAVETTRLVVPRHAYPAIPTRKIRAIVSSGPASPQVSARGSDTNDHDVRTDMAYRDCGRVQSGSIVEKLALRARREASADDDSGENLVSCLAWSAWRCIG